MANLPNPPEPPRIAKLRSDIVAAIPCLKHQSEAQQELQQLPLNGLLHAYLKWADRFVPAWPREVSFAPSFWEAAVAKSHRGEILAMARRIEEGQDLSRHLSPRLQTSGYELRRVRDQALPEKKRWGRDRDFVLNVLGLHHLHISGGVEEDGNLHGAELAFVEFAQGTAVFVYAGTYAEFHDPELTARLSEAVAQVRARAGTTINEMRLGGPTPHISLMELARVGLSAAAAVDGKLVPHAMIASDGTPVLLSLHLRVIHRALVELEPQIDSPEYAIREFERAGRALPPTVSFRWLFRCTELDLVEETSGILFVIVPALQRRI